MIMLPNLGNAAQFHLFHYPLIQSGQNFILRNLLHTVVDLSANGGEGTTLFKNQIVVDDTLDADGLHAVRHANGRDWWVVCAKRRAPKFHFLLLTPDTIFVHAQTIGDSSTVTTYGEIVFSPDGSKLARFDAKDDLFIFDFDRCTGTLSNPLHIPIIDDADNEIFAGLAFSVDGRYLYAAEVKRLLQFDMQAPDIAASQTLVAERVLDPDCSLGSAIGWLELGPDGRIYCRPGNGQHCMHRLARPELPGPAADFVQYYYKFDFSYKNMPHFPNFRLGPLDGSPCDTLGLDNHPLANWRYDRTGLLAFDFTSVSWYEPTDWQWDFGDPASGSANNSAERNPAHEFSAPGAYEVCLTVSNANGSDTKCKWVWAVTTSLTPQPPLQGRVGVTLYPNPTTGELRWRGLPEGEEVIVRVFDALGRVVVERDTREAVVRLDGLPAGLYFVSLSDALGRRLAGKTILLEK